MTCVNFQPIYDSSAGTSYAAIVDGADNTSTLAFQRSIDLSNGAGPSSWCHLDDDSLIPSDCGLPGSAMVDYYLGASGKVTIPASSTDTFGVYGCKAERYNWTTESTTVFIRDDGNKAS